MKFVTHISKNSKHINVNESNYGYTSIADLHLPGIDISKLPYSVRILLESAVRNFDGKAVTEQHIKDIASMNVGAEIPFIPARVVLQDFTGVPAVVDLASMRTAAEKAGGDPMKINPQLPVDLVIDHSVQVDSYGPDESININSELEFKRNRERYEFLKWGAKAFDNFRVVPPATGIVHQVNLEYLAKVVWTSKDGKTIYPDSLVGTDSHTPMINGIGVLGWGVGGIEAEAAMLGQPIYMVMPEVIGFKLNGKLKPGITATDAILVITEILRKKGVVGKFVEFYGPGVNTLSVPDRATISNMTPECGSTVNFFPVDDKVLEYLSFTGRSDEEVTLVEDYMKTQGLFRTSSSTWPEFNDNIELDLSEVEPSVAGPSKPQDRISLGGMKTRFSEDFKDCDNSAVIKRSEKEFELKDGSVVIAAITSCTNTSNPELLITAGLLARNAVKKGLKVKPWVKTSTAPGSTVVSDYYNSSGLMPYLEELGFHIVGYGCTTCIGNSGPLDDDILNAVNDNDLTVCSVLSGNRNFPGRISPSVKGSYLMSPPLVVAYALAGKIDIDLTAESLGTDVDGEPVYLNDIWPGEEEIREVTDSSVNAEMFKKAYSSVFEGNEEWNSISSENSSIYPWSEESSYIKNAPFFEELSDKPVRNIKNATVLALLGDTVTTDH